MQIVYFICVIHFCHCSCLIVEQLTSPALNLSFNQVSYTMVNWDSLTRVLFSHYANVRCQFRLLLVLSFITYFILSSYFILVLTTIICSFYKKGHITHLCFTVLGATIHVLSVLNVSIYLCVLCVVFICNCFVCLVLVFCGSCVCVF